MSANYARNLVKEIVEKIKLLGDVARVHRHARTSFGVRSQAGSVDAWLSFARSVSACCGRTRRLMGAGSSSRRRPGYLDQRSSASRVLTAAA